MSSASVIVEDRDGRVLLLLRGPSESWMPHRWDLPGGGVEPGESPAQGAARELREETGLRARSLVPISRSRSRTGVHDVFYAKSWSGHVALDDEHVAHAWVSPAEAVDWDVVPPLRTTLRLFALARS